MKIDNQDLSFIGDWPIDRRWYASIAESSIKANANAVFFDVSFRNINDKNPISDEFLFMVLTKMNVYVQHFDSVISDTNQILGSKLLPINKYWNDFESEIQLKEHYFIYTPSLAIAEEFKLDQDVFNLRYPTEHDTLTSYTMKEIISQTNDLKSKNIIVGTDIDGLTSYIPIPGSDNVLTPTELRVFAISMAQKNETIRFLSWAVFIGILILLAPVLVFTKRLSFNVVALIFLISMAILFISDVFIFDILQFLMVIIYMILFIGKIALSYIQYKSNYDPKQIADSHYEIEELGKQLSKLEKKLSYYESDELPEEQASSYISGNLIYSSDSPLRTIIKKIEIIALKDISVMIFGETGTGKEEIAKLIHLNSSRRNQDLITINCGAFSQNLIESELFGHEVGAFTGAIKQKIGKFELANNSTLFLDEIADMPLDTQVKILRVIQNGTFERVGGNETIKVNVRIIAATHKHILDLISKGEFREDLYFRLNGYEINIPPLRERKNDIVAITRNMVINNYKDSSIKITEATLDWISNQEWPGNVRQLYSSIERAFLNCEVAKRHKIIPQDFEMDFASEESHDLGEQILLKMREKSFKHNAISQIAEELKIHRVTVTENWRGVIIHHYIRSKFDKDVCAELIIRGMEKNEKAKDRVFKYLNTILDKMTKGLIEKLDFDHMRKTYFYNLPKSYLKDLEQVYTHFKAGK